MMHQVISPYMRNQDMISPVAPRTTKTASQNHRANNAFKQQQHSSSQQRNTGVQ